ncbi:hypothetical protein CDAR_374061 [Caerostris darwini]|uniref:Uncharacterized protein n=1 Tax=Caerostris darwini TaxID=1538125 RepID=A0AAV4VJK3_9ARAC|nr:hypothetical protein CDAR_374061 [Caerostris darwini]
MSRRDHVKTTITHHPSIKHAKREQGLCCHQRLMVGCDSGDCAFNHLSKQRCEDVTPMAKLVDDGSLSPCATSSFRRTPVSRDDLVRLIYRHCGKGSSNFQG